MDAAVVRAQQAAGEALLNALGPLADALRLRPSGKAAIAAGQPVGWAAAREVLVGAKLKSVTPEQAEELMSQGWVLCDVSPAEDFADAHAQSSVSTPSVRYTSGSSGSLRDTLRAAAFSSLAVRPLAEVSDDEFLASVQSAAGGTAAGVILACASGGSLRPTANFPAGQASRSLTACRTLLQSRALPAERVVHLRGGLAAWFKGGREAGGEGDWSARKGRTPTADLGPTWEQDNADLL